MRKFLKIFLELRLYRTLLAFLFSIGIIKISVDWYELPPSIKEFPTILIAEAGLVFTYLAWQAREPLSGSIKIWKPAIWISITFVFSFITLLPFIFIFETFGTTSFGTSLFTVLENSTADLLSIEIGRASCRERV